MKTLWVKGAIGASLIETLIALALGAVVTTSSFNLLVSQDRIYSMEGQAEKTQRNARLALDTMGRDIRLAGYQTQNPSPTADIDLAQSATFAFRADIDNNGVAEKICYVWNDDANQITRQVWTWNAASSSWASAGAPPVADYISTLSFTYRDAGGNVTTVLANIRVVHVSLTATSPKADPVSGRYRTMSLSMDITPRNLGY